MKVFSSQWRLRKQTAIVNQEEEQAARLAHSNAWRHRHGADTVPFGIRAMGTGHDVEATWISQSDTLQSTDKSSPISSSYVTTNKETIADIKAAVDLALAQHRPNSQGSLIPSGVHPARRQQQQQQELDEEPRGRTQGKPDYIPYTLRISEPQQALQEIDAVYRAPRWFREESQTRSLTDSAYGDEYITPDYSVKAMHGSPRCAKAPERIDTHQSVDFTLLDKHRYSQAAETGQLTARNINKLTICTGLATADRGCSVPPSSPFSPETKTNQTPPFSPQRRAQSSPRVSPTAVAEALSAAESPALRSPITPFADFVLNIPPSPTLNTFTPREDQKLSPSYVPTAYKQHRVEPVSNGKNGPRISGTTELAETSLRRRSFEKINTQRDAIVRGHGTGFEILKPGSLQDMDSRLEDQHQRSAPPVSIRNFSRPRLRSVSRGRKLQKRQPSADSQASSHSPSTSRSRFSVVDKWSRRNSIQ